MTKTIIYHQNKTIVILTDVYFAVRKLIPCFLNFKNTFVHCSSNVK